MDRLIDKFWDKHPSIYVALAAWGIMAFTAQPTLASMMVHFGFSTIFLATIVLLARHEGWRKGYNEGYAEGLVRGYTEGHPDQAA